MKDKVVIVTGATRGIGRAIAEHFSASGARVIASYYQSSNDADELKKKFPNILLVEGDISNPDTCKKLKQVAMDAFGRVDVLVNNAGQIVMDASWNGYTQETLHRSFEINLFAPMNLVQEIAPIMQQQKSGSVVNISSTFGIMGAAPVLTYTTAKAGLINLTKSMAIELAPYNVRVNAVAPGIIDTDMTAAAGEDLINFMIEATPMKRIGTTKEIAKAVAFLTSDDASFITGHTLVVDGGHMLVN